MTHAAVPATTATNETDGTREARSWVARQLRFEHMLGSLERRVALQLDELASSRRP
ncbi:MAG TPA: hypothetical protein VGZ52_05035 [Acidimicrobiales bacterium]|jgi:hypothetical protein|nr:hypothetical protein [Acidimicrobiales bacterium]